MYFTSKSAIVDYYVINYQCTTHIIVVHWAYTFSVLLEIKYHNASSLYLQLTKQNSVNLVTNIPQHSGVAKI